MAPNGTAVYTVPGFDSTPGQSITYAITAGNVGNAFAINAATGAITVNIATPLDFETTPVFTLTIQVTDDGVPSLSGVGTLTVNLTNVDEGTTDIVVNSLTTNGTSQLSISYTIVASFCPVIGLRFVRSADALFDAGDTTAAPNFVLTMNGTACTYVQSSVNSFRLRSAGGADTLSQGTTGSSGPQMTSSQT